MVKNGRSFRRPSDEITKQKSLKGKDIIVYGGASFDSSLIRAGLIDKYHLFINHVTIGKGLTILRLERDSEIQSDSVAFVCGIVELQYEPKSDILD